MLSTHSPTDAFDLHALTQAQKKRKPDRACDACRRRKKRCDGPQMPNNCCSSCLQSERLCTYMESSKPRGPPKAYVIGLENKMEKLEKLLERLYPGVNFSDELGSPVLRDSWKTEQPPSSDRRPDAPLHLLPELRLPSSARMKHGRYRYRGRDVEEDCADSDGSSSSDENYDTSDSETLARSPAAALTLKRSTEFANFAEDPQTARFHGKTSVHGLVDATRKYRQMLLNQSGGPTIHGTMERIPSNLLVSGRRRPEYWQSPKWELTWDGYRFDSKDSIIDILASFPPLELARSLIDLFFEYTNILYPFLHRPTFERQFKEKLYERDICYLGICNLLFAIASRFSNDPRVVPSSAKTPTGDLDWCKAGWDYFHVGMYIHSIRRSLFLPATLFEIQSLILTSWFLRSTPAYASAWPITGTGLRKAQDVGAHRKKMYRGKATVDGELWKRAFWVLVLLDTFSALTLGRPPCINQEDYDLDLPLEVDDEYWETSNPENAFKQPQGVPAKASAFNWCIKIGWIMNFTNKTLYAIDKSASFVPKTRSRAEQILKDIEVALDEWFTALPEHLKWSDDKEDPVFISQAAMVYLLYRSAQIIVYKPFTTRPSDSQKSQGQSDSISAKALQSSTAAARSIVRVIKIKKTGKIAGTTVEFYASYYAAGQLLLRIWDLKAQVKARRDKQDKNKNLRNEAQYEDRSILSLTQEIDELTADVYTVMALYEKHQGRWEFVQPILERIKASLPKDGEMLQPDMWYQTTAKYFGSDDVTSQDPSTVPGGPAALYSHGQPSQDLQSTAVSNFPSVSSQAPSQGRPVQSRAGQEDSISPGLLGPSIGTMAAPSFADASQSYPKNTSQDLQFDVRQAGSYRLTEEQQTQAQIDGRSEAYQTTTQGSASYQTPLYNLFTPAQHFGPGYPFDFGEILLMAENQQATVTPDTGRNLAPVASAFPKDQLGLAVAPEYYYHEPQSVHMGPAAIRRSAEVNPLLVNNHMHSFSDPAIPTVLPRITNPTVDPYYTERYFDPADHAGLDRIPSQQLVWPSSEPNPFLAQSIFYGHFL